MKSREPRVIPEKRLRTNEIVFLLQLVVFLIGKDAQPRFSIDHSERDRAVINRVHGVMIINGRDKFGIGRW